MKKIQSSLITIAGQTTALVETSTAPLASRSRAALAKSIMEKDPSVEQVGFIDQDSLLYPQFSMMGKNQTIQPVVFVKATQSLVWESACGSGSLAFYALTGNKMIKQPSGATLQITSQDGKLQVIVTSKDILYEK